MMRSQSGDLGCHLTLSTPPQARRGRYGRGLSRRGHPARCRVAIKLLPGDAVSDERARKRLVREARAAATLDHANICSVFEVGEDGGRDFIVMQYVEGETLAARIVRGPLEIADALDVAVQVADGLSEAHSRGIIHRDIKTQNIMLTPRGQAKLMDFGLARVSLPQESLVESEVNTQSGLTEAGTILGTVPYMSPEQVKGEALDARSDIFSFGTVLYEIVTGAQPFAGASPAATIGNSQPGASTPSKVLARGSAGTGADLN